MVLLIKSIKNSFEMLKGLKYISWFEDLWDVEFWIFGPRLAFIGKLLLFVQIILEIVVSTIVWR